jgi:hypothetical protein
LEQSSFGGVDAASVKSVNAEASGGVDVGLAIIHKEDFAGLAAQRVDDVAKRRFIGLEAAHKVRGEVAVERREKAGVAHELGPVDGVGVAERGASVAARNTLDQLDGSGKYSKRPEPEMF